MGLGDLTVRLTVHVLPISSFAFRHPLNGRFEASLASVLSFGFSNPFGIFLLVAVAEGFENSKGLRVFLQLFHEVVRDNQRRFFLRPGSRGYLDSFVI